MLDGTELEPTGRRFCESAVVRGTADAVLGMASRATEACFDDLCKIFCGSGDAELTRHVADRASEMVDDVRIRLPAMHGDEASQALHQFASTVRARDETLVWCDEMCAWTRLCGAVAQSVHVLSDRGFIE